MRTLILRMAVLFALFAIFVSGFFMYDLIKIQNEKPFSLNVTEIISPKDRIKESDIHLSNDKVVIVIPNSYIARFANTKSMDPVLDIEANAIEIRPSSPEELIVGDIISYKSKISQDVIIHRIVYIGYDDKGWYAIAKGDNNKNPDPEKIRFEQIKGVVVAIIY